jgi:hypothetical protein
MTDIRNAWSKSRLLAIIYAYSRDIGAQKYAQNRLALVHAALRQAS